MTLAIIEHEESFELATPTGRRLMAYVYFGEAGRDLIQPRLTKAQARRLVENIAAAPGVLDGVREAK